MRRLEVVSHIPVPPQIRQKNLKAKKSLGNFQGFFFMLNFIGDFSSSRKPSGLTRNDTQQFAVISNPVLSTVEGECETSKHLTHNINPTMTEKEISRRHENRDSVEMTHNNLQSFRTLS